jgi:hypothetical protein
VRREGGREGGREVLYGKVVGSLEQQLVSLEIDQVAQMAAACEVG